MYRMLAWQNIYEHFMKTRYTEVLRYNGFYWRFTANVDSKKIMRTRCSRSMVAIASKSVS